jgi:hypothetical protein
VRAAYFPVRTGAAALRQRLANCRRFVRAGAGGGAALRAGLVAEAARAEALVERDEALGREPGAAAGVDYAVVFRR